jgi:putative transcriptional regulator
MPPSPVRSRATSSTQRGPSGSDGSVRLRRARSSHASNSWTARIIAALSAFAFATLAAAQSPANGALLIAKPELDDPNFSRTVVLVTQAESGETVGVILNRPTQRTEPRTGAVLYSGGPVMREVVVAVFRSAQPPAAPAFRVLRNVYLSMHPATLSRLLEGEARDYRLYSGFSGWAPRQLEAEMLRDGWHVLPATEELVFRADTAGMWEDLVEKARGGRTESRLIPHRRTAK